MNLDPELMNSVRVLCALTGNPYYLTGQTCETCGGNDVILDLPQYRPSTFCAEDAVRACRESPRALLRKFADVLDMIGIDFTGVDVAQG